MFASVGGVTTLVVWCFRKVLGAPPDPGDEDDEGT
jgi:hypothetical protein